MLSGARTVALRRAPVRTKQPARTRRSATPAAAADLDAAQAALFERLRAWRAAVAKEQGVPAYVVFHDATLRELAQRRPASTAELGAVSGIGQAKIERYGAGVLEVLAEG